MDFSIIIPVYNCNAYLRSCVDSVLAAGLTSLEILLIDDGSTDGSEALCDALSLKYPEVRVIHQNNAGVSAARNTGLQAACGTLLLFLDADDTIDSAALKNILIDPRCSQCDMTIFGLSFDYFHQGRCYRQDPLFFPGDRTLSCCEWSKRFVELYLYNSLSPLWNKVFRRELIEKNQLKLNTSMFLYEDLEFVLRYLACCDSIWNVPKTVYHYRQTEDEGNAKRRLSRIDSIPEFLSPIDAALHALNSRKNGVSEVQCQEILFRLYHVLVREKIAVSDIPGIRRICADYALWSQQRPPLLEQPQFHHQLIECKAFSLWLNNKKSHIRHYIAVRVKAAWHRIREERQKRAH